MILGIDHLVIAVHDPDAAVSELAWLLGLPAGTSGGRHNAWGTRNRLLWLGDTFIELVTVFDHRLAERSWLGRATLAALPDAPAAICWALSTDDIDLDRSAMNAAGARLAQATSGERRRPDGEIVRWRLALPAEVGLGRPFLIEHDGSAAEWTATDRAARAATPARVMGLALPVDAIEGLPDAADGIWLGEQVVGIGGPDANGPTVRIGGLDRDGARADALGCRWLLD